MNNFNDIAKDTLDEWIYFLKNEEIKDDFKAKGLEKAKQELDILKLPEQERLAYARYQDDLHYQASMVESSYVVGMKKGEKKGREKGKEEGRKERDIEIARNLLRVGQLDVQTSARVIGLDSGRKRNPATRGV